MSEEDSCDTSVDSFSDSSADSSPSSSMDFSSDSSSGSFDLSLDDSSVDSSSDSSSDSLDLSSDDSGSMEASYEESFDSGDTSTDEALPEGGGEMLDEAPPSEDAYGESAEEMPSNNVPLSDATLEEASLPEAGDAAEPLAEPPILPDEYREERGESVEAYHGFERGAHEMTYEEKEAYGISPEVERFAETGEDYEVKLPSQMSDTSLGDESTEQMVDESEVGLQQDLNPDSSGLSDAALEETQDAEATAEDNQVEVDVPESEEGSRAEAVAEEEQKTAILEEAEQQEAATIDTGDTAAQKADEAEAAARGAEAAAERLKDVDVSDSAAVEAAVKDAEGKGADAQRLSGVAADASDAAESASAQAREVSELAADTAAEQAKEAENASDAAERAARDTEEESRRLQEEADKSESDAVQVQEEYPQQDAQETGPLEPEPDESRGAETSVEEVEVEGGGKQLDTWNADANVTLQPDEAGSEQDGETEQDALLKECLENQNQPPEERIDGYKEEIGHNELADIEAYRNIKNGERIEESMRDNYTAGGVDDAYKNIHETRTDIGANNDMADKMTEYTISQGHVADYTDSHGESPSEQLDAGPQETLNGDGLKDILAKASADGEEVPRPPDDSGMDDKARSDQRDEVAYNAWIAQKAKER